MLKGPGVRLVCPPAPQHGAIELQRLSDLPKAVDDRVVDAVQIDGAEADGHVGGESLEVRVRVRRLRQAGLDVEPLGHVDNRRHDMA